MDSSSKNKQIGLKQRTKIRDSLKNQAEGLDKRSKPASEALKKEDSLSSAPESTQTRIISSLKKKGAFLSEGSKERLAKDFKKKEDLLKKRAEKAESEFLYLRAEFENYKRRVLEEKINLIRYSGEKFISELATEVLDDLERALFASQGQKSVEDLQKGLKMINKKLKKLFEKFGVEVLDPKGKPFDPACQEALSYVEKEDLPEDQVIETYKKAYKLYDKVIRPAQVLVSKKASKDLG